MDQRRIIGFVVIVILYAVVGFLAAMGTILLARKTLAPKTEQIFYAIFLAMIAAFYLAFAAYFGPPSVWRLEWAVVMAFVATGLLGTRLPSALILGYSLHALWDLLHELQAHRALFSFLVGHLTAIPFAYGVFCAAFDICVAVYLFSRRSEWAVVWTTQRPAEGAYSLGGWRLISFWQAWGSWF